MKNTALFVFYAMVIFLTGLFSRDTPRVILEEKNVLVETELQNAKSKYSLAKQEVKILKTEIRKEIDSIKTKI